MTTPAFLGHFGLPNLRDLPGYDDIEAAGLLGAAPLSEDLRRAFGQFEQAEIRRVLDKVSGEVGARVGPRDYRAAQRIVLGLMQAGRMNEAVLAGFADAVSGATFDEVKARESAALRVATAERLRDAVTAALGKLHALLDNDQRERLAYLIRTGVLTL